jgi:hypothetical protein
VDSFDEASLLAELAEEEQGDDGDDNDDGFESHEELMLMRQLAAMPDAAAAEERALLASIHGMEETPDEGDVLMEALLKEEKGTQDAVKATRAANAEAAARVQRAMASSSSSPSTVTVTGAQLRAACTAAKHEAVRLKRAGDLDGARNALRKSKELQAKGEAAEAAEAAEAKPRAQQPPPPTVQPRETAQTALAAALRALGDSVKVDDYYEEGDGEGEGEPAEELRSELGALDGETTTTQQPPPPPTTTPPMRVEELREAVAGAKREAVGHKRAGDMDRARASLKLSKELQATLDALLAEQQQQQATAAATSGRRSTTSSPTTTTVAAAGALPLTNQEVDLDAMVAAAIGAVVSVISEVGLALYMLFCSKNTNS